MTDAQVPDRRAADASLALTTSASSRRLAASPDYQSAMNDAEPAKREGGRPSRWTSIRAVAMTVLTALIVGFKYLASLKFLLLPILKFLPLVLKTGGTMVLSVAAYAMLWGWRYALGFVVLILIHECGHLVVARSMGLKVGAPVFIPFMGAFIALKDAPRNAWVESLVGLGGPLLGSVGALACALIGNYLESPFWYALAYSGCMLNLFNLIPIGTLDGGRIVTALSPWLWIVGTLVLGALLIVHPNLLLGLVLILSLPRLWSLFRAKSAAERRYFEVSASQRLLIGTLYIGLAGALAWGMAACSVPPPAAPDQTAEQAVPGAADPE
jgi:Zn-dependent protease